jgi:hypothetical protein
MGKKYGMDEEFETLVDASRLYGNELMVNGDFHYNGETLSANTGQDGFVIYAGVESGPVETLDAFNTYFPIRGNLMVAREDMEGYDTRVLDEIDGHAYHIYETDEWEVMNHDYDSFGLFWNREPDARLPDGEHALAIVSNSEDYDTDARSVEPVNNVLPELIDGVEEPLVGELQAFALMEPEEFGTEDK